MLYKTSKEILDHLESLPQGYSTIDNLAKAMNMQFAECQQCCMFLEEKNLVVVEKPYKIGPMQTPISHWAVRLAHIGRHRGEFTKLNFLEYLKEHWIDILALLVAIGAFIVSLIALKYSLLG